MNKFFLRLALVFAFIICLDILLGNAMRYLFAHQRSGEYYYVHKDFYSSVEDIVIFGTSRANKHYDPDIIQKKLHLSTYNTGKDGQGFFYCYAALSAMLTRYSPKVIICDLYPNLFVEYGKIHEYGLLTPIRDDFPVINELLDKAGPLEKYKLLSRVYPYNSKFFDLLLGYTRPPRNNNNGFKSIPGVIDPAFFKANKPDFSIADTFNYYYFDKFCQVAKQKNIPVVFCISPMYIHPEHQEIVTDRLRAQIKKYGYSLIDYSSAPQFLGRYDLFKDQTHLNTVGAEIFSQEFADSLSSLYRSLP
jgi:hypothetical protein